MLHTHTNTQINTHTQRERIECGDREKKTPPDYQILNILVLIFTKVRFLFGPTLRRPPPPCARPLSTDVISLAWRVVEKCAGRLLAFGQLGRTRFICAYDGKNITTRAPPNRPCMCRLVVG